MKDYSQDREQAAILAAFEGANPGIFLDIGAWHPKRLSNTRALFELGWGGVMVEPSPYPMRNLLDEYGKEPRIALIQACVMTSSQLPKLHVSDDAFSTSEGAQFEKWNRNIKFIGELYVPSITLAEIGYRFGMPDFVDIDTEGTSGELFFKMLDLNWRPRCVCIELDGRSGELRVAAAEAGYDLNFENATNAVFVRPANAKEKAA